MNKAPKAVQIYSQFDIGISIASAPDKTLMINPVDIETTSKINMFLNIKTYPNIINRYEIIANKKSSPIKKAKNKAIKPIINDEIRAKNTDNLPDAIGLYFFMG